MSKNPTGFKITDSDVGWNSADFDDVFIRKDCFTDGGLWLWSSGLTGRLGTNNIIDRSSPVQTVSGGTDWRSVSIYTHSAAIKTDGTLWVWGSNAGGRLGTNDIIDRSSPVQTVSGGTNWRSVSVRSTHSAAIKTDGSLWLWGSGSNGRLGINDIINRSSPVQTVSGGTDWRSVSVGNSHSAAIKTDGTLWVWGSNASGRLGTDDIIDRSSPVQTVSGGNNWRSVSGGGAHSAAIKTDGSLWLWGSSTNGQVGTDDLVARSSPVQTVSGGNNWRSVSAGFAHTAAIKTDGSLWVWGLGTYGRLGTNNIIDRSSPVQTVSGGTNWRSVSAGFAHTAAIKTDGSLWLWGSNANGRLGINNTINRSSPVQTVSGGTNWRSVSAGSVHSAAIREGCW